MNLSALFTSAGINIVICFVLFSLYSVLRKQPSLVNVYFGQKLAQVKSKRQTFCFDRLFPSPSWIKKAWETSEDDLFTVGGVDAVVFIRAVSFSVRVMTVASLICLFLVLPLNYFGKEIEHKYIPDEPLNVFTIGNVKEGSRWLWGHCFALYIITCCACLLLYFEYKSITEMRLAHISTSMSYPSHFTIIVRSVPWVQGRSYSEVVKNFFMDFYASSYLSHQMIYRSKAFQRMMTDAERIYKTLKSAPTQTNWRSRLMRCGFCGETTSSFKIVSDEPNPGPNEEIQFDCSELRTQESGATLVFFRTRYDALIAYEALQSPNPMLWVTDPAPEPRDMLWTNLCVPYRILWIRKITVLVTSILFVGFFLIPVVFTQSLVNLEKLANIFPSLKDILQRKVLKQLITGYLPSVIQMFFLYFVPPIMILFSTLEGAISRSGRKKSACLKVIYFQIWNLFFVNIFTEAAIDHYLVSIADLGDPRNMPNLLAKSVPTTATFFTTYVLTSGWASLSLELIQPFSLLCNWFYKYILRNNDVSTYGTYTFPYHTEVPRVLLFGLLGFTCSILTPIILPFLLVYFILAYLVYRNQLLNVYVTKYDSGGLYWPIVHTTTIFSLVLTQIIALGVFGIKKSPTASGFTVPLIICTLLFNEYCRHRFLPVFNKTPAKIMIEMDRIDEHCGRLGEIYQNLETAYCQFKTKHITPHGYMKREESIPRLDGSVNSILRNKADLEINLSDYRSMIELPESKSGPKKSKTDKIHGKM